jgi:hypothetical protein
MPIEVLKMHPSVEALNIQINRRLSRRDAELLHITPYQYNGTTDGYIVVFQVLESAEARLAPLAGVSQVASDGSSITDVPVAEALGIGGRKTCRRRGRKRRTSRKH